VLLGVGLFPDVDEHEVSPTLCDCLCFIMDKGIDHCPSCVSEVTDLRFVTESGVSCGWSPVVGLNLHFQNPQEYVEVCEDVTALNEKALADRNLWRVTPDIPPDQEKTWIRVMGTNAFNIAPIEISRIYWCLSILEMGSSNLEKVTEPLGGSDPRRVSVTGSHLTIPRRMDLGIYFHLNNPHLLILCPESFF